MLSIYLITLVLLLFYTIGLLILRRGLARLEEGGTQTGTPFVSVIVSAHNETRNIASCLSHLKAQDYPEDKIEFIIVADRSTDDTLEIIDSFRRKDRRFHALSIEDRLPDFAPKKRAIDLAIGTARGSIIIHTDADGRPGKSWVRHMVGYFTDETDMVLGYAPYRLSSPTSVSGRMLALEYLSHAAIAAATTGLGYPVTCVGTNLAYRKSLYLEIGGFGKFKRFISGDDDLLLTLVREQKKYHIAYALPAESHVYNNPPDSVHKFIHQRMRYASKGFYYQPKVTLTLIAYFTMNFFIFSGAIAALFGLFSGMFVVGVTAFKAGVEFWFMKKAATALGDRRSIDLILPASVLHIPYVVIFGILGQFGYFKWAENRAEKAVQQYVNY